MHYNQQENICALLEQLVAIPSISDSNYTNLNDFIVRQLRPIASEIIQGEPDNNNNRNIFVRIGPNVSGGLMFAGHMDIVDINESEWNSDPFTLIRRNGKLYGRGTTDMKGFLSCILTLAQNTNSLKKPLYLCFTHTEEINMKGAKELGRHLKKNNISPDLCILGEPTSLAPVTAHKGVTDIKITAKGTAMHASRSPYGTNAIVQLGHFISALNMLSQHYALNPKKDSPFDPPFSSFNIGTIKGGTSINTVAAEAELNMEYRTHPGDRAQKIYKEIESLALKSGVLSLSIETDIPAFTGKKSQHILNDFWPEEQNRAVSFCTEAGFYEQAGIPTIVYGPGSIEQAHQSNEYIEETQLFKCLQTLQNIKNKLYY